MFGFICAASCLVFGKGRSKSTTRNQPPENEFGLALGSVCSPEYFILTLTLQHNLLLFYYLAELQEEWGNHLANEVFSNRKKEGMNKKSIIRDRPALPWQLKKLMTSKLEPKDFIVLSYYKSTKSNTVQLIIMPITCSRECLMKLLSIVGNQSLFGASY